jgi:ATP-dependent Lon protease
MSKIHSTKIAGKKVDNKIKNKKDAKTTKTNNKYKECSSSSDDDSDYDDGETLYSTTEDDDTDTDTKKTEEKTDDDEGTEEDDKKRKKTKKEKASQELQKILTSMFPSKYLKEKNEKMSKKRYSKKNKKYQSSDEDESDNSSEEEEKRPNRRRTRSHKKNKKYQSSEEDDDDGSSEEEEERKSSRRRTRSHNKNKKYQSSEEDDDSSSEEEKISFPKGKNFNIIFDMDRNSNADEYMDWFDEDDDDELLYEENENEECNSDDEAKFMKESYEKIDVDDGVLIKEDKKKTKKEKRQEKQKKAEEKQKSIEEEAKNVNVDKKYKELVEMKKNMIENLKKEPTNTIIQKIICECNNSIKELVKKGRNTNTKEYHKMISAKSFKTNEIEYFKKNLSNKQQQEIMKDLKEINKFIHIEKPYRVALLESKIPAKYKANVLQKLTMLQTMDPGDNEYFKLKNWIDNFMRIPFDTNKSLSISMDDGIDACNQFMENAMNILDTSVYGLEDAKMQILQMVGQWISNPSAMGTAIAICGNAGTGKTTLVKEGISKILGREFAFIALGGAGDSSFLEGHSYTYEGSTWGKIIQILMDSKCMNPVIYFDELDKISDTPRGEEIIGILTHLTDTSQNSAFHDKYFTDVDFDLSKCLFIFSYNDASKVNPILKDRMYSIQTKGYEVKQKIIIARNYLLPKIREQVKFKDDEIIIPDETLSYIITNGGLTKNEEGVRNLKRCLEIIHTKLNLFRLLKPDSKILSKELDFKVEFPITVTRKEVDILIKNDTQQNQSLLAMYV